MTEQEQTEMNETEQPEDGAKIETAAAESDSAAEARSLEAANVIKRHVVVAMAAGLVPLPIFDVSVQVGNQVKMVHALSEIYEVPFKQKAARAIILSLIGGSAPTLAVSALSSGAKIIPGIGSLVGSGGVSLAGGATTYAVGTVFADHFAKGGQMVDLDLGKARALFRRNLRKGRDVAKDAADETAGQGAAKAA